jgi:hypothetical protein
LVQEFKKSKMALSKVVITIEIKECSCEFIQVNKLQGFCIG